jgi:hypothetical protein
MVETSDLLGALDFMRNNGLRHFMVESQQNGGPDQGPTSTYETRFCFAFVSPKTGCFRGFRE